MNRSRSYRCSFAWVLVLGLSCAAVSAAQETGGSIAPSGQAPEGPRSRLTIAGLYETDSYLQKNFFLGARGGVNGQGERDGFWTQRLSLRPRFILSDHLNINLSFDLAQGVWGANHLEGEAGETGRRHDFYDLRIDRAYLAWRHPGSRTRWYLGRQEYAFGNLLALDADLPGLQVHRDFGRRLRVGLGFAKESEAGLADLKTVVPGVVQPDSVIADERDADLWFADARLGAPDGRLRFSPFFLYYLDRNNGDGSTALPDGYLPGARFQPQITRATVLGVALAAKTGRLQADLEFDYLKGVDRVRNADSGLDERHDVNNGDLQGMNLFGRLALTGGRLDLSGTVVLASGDPDPFQFEGNINSLRNDGRWFLTEVWENGLALDRQGLAPQGLGNPFVRAYRGVENTTAVQGALAFRLRSNLKVGGSFTLLRATEALRPWTDLDQDGRISREEWGKEADGKSGESTELGSEIDGLLEWLPDPRVTLSLRGGIFSPGPAAGYLINGTQTYQESPFGLRFSVAVPIPEFSLGG